MTSDQKHPPKPVARAFFTSGTWRFVTLSHDLDGRLGHAQDGCCPNTIGTDHPSRGIDGNLSAHVGISLPDELRSLSGTTELQILDPLEPGPGIGQVELGNVQFLSRLRYARLFVGVPGSPLQGDQSLGIVGRVPEPGIGMSNGRSP